jgi:GTP-binding protein
LISSKSDVATQETLKDSLRISSVTGEGIQELIYKLEELVRNARETEISSTDEVIIHRPIPKGISVVKDGDVFVVKGRQAERAVSLNDLTNIEALEYIQSVLEKIGVNKALRKAGVKSGDQVRIGGLHFEFMDDDEHWIE